MLLIRTPKLVFYHVYYESYGEIHKSGISIDLESSYGLFFSVTHSFYLKLQWKRD